jgi:hypothetical protein
MRSFLRTHLSYATVMSLLAIVVATGGTAWGALVVTGAQVRNSSLTGADVKNASLESSDVSTATRTALKVKGATGPAGAKGPTGADGNAGPVGDKGSPARNAYAWALNTQNSLLRVNGSDNYSPSPPVGPENWYPSQAGTGTDWRRPDSLWGNMGLELADGTNDGLLVLEWRSDVLAVAHLTAWHEDGTDEATPGVQSRLECRLRIVDIATNSQATIGQPVMIATDAFRHVVDFGLVGGIRREPGTYSIRVECRDLDLDTTSTVAIDQWFSVKGNLSILSSRDWR